MRCKPYVGVTGFKTVQEIKRVCRVFGIEGFGEGNNYRSMIGFLVSEKRMSMPDVGGKRSPQVNSLQALASHCPRESLPMMHYFTKSGETLSEQIDTLFSLDRMYEENHCRALQLNVVWPPLSQMEKIISKFPKMEIVLQLPERATEGLSAGEVANRAKAYDPLVSYALVDPSGGLGIEFDVDKSTELMFALREAMPTTRLGIAGGLGPENVRTMVEAVTKNFKDPFCIDAEGKLRDEGPNHNKLDIDKTATYIERASDFLLAPKIIT